MSIRQGVIPSRKIKKTAYAEGLRLNAPFDWSFINYYFLKFHGENPFGFTALDIKALYMGKFGGVWGDTKSSAISAHLNPQSSGDHTALADARYQAELFRLILANDSEEK